MPGELTTQKWFSAAKQGRSFATTGPMLLLKVNGLEPGEESRGQKFPLEAKVEVTLLSVDKAESVDIVVNGRIAAIPLVGDAANKFAYSAKTILLLDSSSWITARYLAKRGNALNLAHTSPVYFWKDNEGIPLDRKSADYLLARSNSLIRETKAGRAENGSDSTSNIFDNEGVRALTLQLLEKAKAVYEMKLRP